MASEFKKCPNGHYYQGDHCPYCKPCPSNAKESITIGRSSDNDFVIIDPLVNRVHCRIEIIGEERYRITDLQSKNGTYVNGKRIEGSMEIGPFDDVMVGESHVQWLHQFAGHSSIFDGHHMSGIVEPPKPHEDSMENKDCLTPKAKEPKWEYYQCPNGHYYQGEKCPYCKPSDPTNDEECQNQKSFSSHIIHKVCKNNHSYDCTHDECPYCGEKEVVNTYEWGRDTIWGESIKLFFQKESTQISINNHVFNSFDCIWINTTRGYKESYGIRINKYDVKTIKINPEDTVIFGRTSMTGKEFIKMCDVVIDNQLALIGI